MRNPITKKPLLIREITLTLIVKFTLIYFLWLWFFSNPIDKELNGPQVQNAILGAHTPVLNQSVPNRNPVEDNKP